ncbi:MAG: thioredoxin family protein [Kiritimatiellaceae bacterium]|nr:thioredoxin family protein [Kiritimatiellaceae bacterium]
MKKNLKNKLITIGVLILAMVVLVEFEKRAKCNAPSCADGLCNLPSEKAGAIVGPHSVPLNMHQATQAPLPQLIDFGAGSCPTCKTMTEVLTELKAETENRLIVRFIDTREDKETPKVYSVRIIPTLIFLDAVGNELYRHEGFISKEDILSKWVELGVNFSNE